MANINVRFSETDRELVKKVCKARGEDMSSFVRRAVRRELASLSFFTEYERKALGVNVEPSGER